MGKLNRRNFCECGCRQVIARHLRFVKGHQNKGRIGYHHLPESKEKCRQTNLETWDFEKKQEHSILMKKVRIETLKKDPSKYKRSPDWRHMEDSKEKNRQAHLGKKIDPESILKGLKTKFGEDFVRKEKSPPQLCACGACGLMTKPGNVYVHGHANKGKGRTKEAQLCECGQCGLMTKPGNKYIRGHQRIGKPGQSWNTGLTKETDPRLAQMSESAKGKPGHTCDDDTREVLSQKTKELWERPGHREYVSEALSGVNHPFYRARPGLNPDDWPRDYPWEWTEELREMIRERDGRECVVCGKPERDFPKKLQVHHVDYNRKHCVPDNLVSLCRSCHGKTAHHRSEWTSFFQSLLNNQQVDYWISKIDPSVIGSGYIREQKLFNIEATQTMYVR